MHVRAIVTAIDLSPEFGDVTGTEALVVVTYRDPRRPDVTTRTLEMTRAEASLYRVGQSVPLVG